jgi:ferredoxin
MREIVSAALSEDAVGADFAALSVPQSYRGAVVPRDESEMFQGMATADKEPSKSPRVREVPTPEPAPGEVLIAVMASSINYNTVWTAIFEPMPTFGFLQRYARSNEPGAARHAVPRGGFRPGGRRAAYRARRAPLARCPMSASPRRLCTAMSTPARSACCAWHPRRGSASETTRCERAAWRVTGSAPTATAVESRPWAPATHDEKETEMAAARVQLDEWKCVTSGQCVLAAPEVFDQREKDGVGIVLTDYPAPELHGKVREAEAGCPAAAIRLLDQ